MKIKKRKYNATYRCRKKGYKINTSEKTCFLPQEAPVTTEMKILKKEYNYATQLCLY